MNLETLVNHRPHPELSSDNTPLVAPIYHSVKYTMPLEEVEKLFQMKREGYLYSRVQNPTVDMLGKTLALMQGEEAAYCYGSGVAAISSTLIHLLKSGDHVIQFIESYAPTRYIIQNILKKYGIESSEISINELDILESIKKENTKAIIFESPTNPQLSIADLELIETFSKKYNIKTIFDNTFASFHNHHQFDFDYIIHSLTKYASGHGDAMGGCVLGKKELILPLAFDSFELGATMDPRVADQILKGLRTFTLRYEKACKNSQEIATFLADIPSIKNLRYPGLENHPSHELAKKQQKDFGAVIFFTLKTQNKEDYYKFFKELKLFTLSGSLGSTESLIAPVDLFYTGNLSEEELKKAELAPFSIRLSIGIEHPVDLIKDLKNALGSLSH